jgi:hypothetical protein
VYRLGKSPASQALNVQIFDCNYSEVLDKPEGELILKLVPLILNPLVNLLQQRNGFTATVRASLTTCNFTLGTPQLCFRSLSTARQVALNFEIAISSNINLLPK